MLEDDPVIISEKDFAPTPSPSPVPFADATSDVGEETAEGTTAESNAIAATAGKTAATEDELNSSAVVSDGEEEDGAEIMAPESGSEPSSASDIVPTAEDVTTVEELALSISDGRDEGTLSEPAVPSARQIVSIGNQDDLFAFRFHEEELNGILCKVPPGWKVCVVSVVGVSRLLSVRGIV